MITSAGALIRYLFGTAVGATIQAFIAFHVSLGIGGAIATSTYGESPMHAYIKIIALMVLLGVLWSVGSYLGGLFAGLIANKQGGWYEVITALFFAMVDLVLIFRFGGYYWLLRLFGGWGRTTVTHIIASLIVCIFMAATVFLVSEGCAAAPRNGKCDFPSVSIVIWVNHADR